MTAKLLVLLRAGTPLSVTFTVIRFVLRPWVSVGVQDSAPVSESSVIPSGPDTRLKATELAGRSESAALTTNASRVFSSIVRSGGRVSVGWVFTSFTTTVKLLVELSDGVPL